MRARPDSSLHLEHLTSLYVDASGSRPVLATGTTYLLANLALGPVRLATLRELRSSTGAAEPAGAEPAAGAGS